MKEEPLSRVKDSAATQAYVADKWWVGCDIEMSLDPHRRDRFRTKELIIRLSSAFVSDNPSPLDPPYIRDPGTRASYQTTRVSTPRIRQYKLIQ